MIGEIVSIVVGAVLLHTVAFVAARSIHGPLFYQCSPQVQRWARQTMYTGLGILWLIIAAFKGVWFALHTPGTMIVVIAAGLEISMRLLHLIYRDRNSELDLKMKPFIGSEPPRWIAHIANRNWAGYHMQGGKLERHKPEPSGPEKLAAWFERLFKRE